MAKSTASVTGTHATPHASLAALGVKLRALDLFAPIRKLVQIPQKTVAHTPSDKLFDCFVGLLAGAKGIADINRVLRADPVLQAAFGRNACAEQSTIQDTLDACSSFSVAQMERAMDTIFRAHSQAVRHDFARASLVLDVDMTGNPCGKKAACASKGYFAGQKNRRGRQVGRVLATPYQEIVVDRLFPGTAQLTTALRPLVEAAEETLGLSAEQRACTILRVDSGGGSLDDVNWSLERGYAVLAKDYSAQRAAKLAQSVRRWYADPKEFGREVGWVEAPPSEYVRPVRRVAVRYRKANGQIGVEVLICAVPKEEIFRQMGIAAPTAEEPKAELLAIAHLYDRRGGGCETSFQGDKQGLGMTKRNKKRFEAQEMVLQLGALAHNVLVWAKGWMVGAAPRLAGYGIARLVRDVMGIVGKVTIGREGELRRIVLNEADRLARWALPGFRELAAGTEVRVALGPT
jgi:hypothetical protein